MLSQITDGMVAYDARKETGKTKSDTGLRRVRRREDSSLDAKKLGGLSGMELYRVVMFEDGEERLDEEGKVIRKGLSAGAVEKLLGKGGRLSKGQMLRCRVRYFTAGAVIGSKKFVNDVFDHSREHFGAKRRTGARKMKGVEEVEGEAIHVLRGLQKGVYGQ